MDLTYHANYHQLREQHWCFAGRHDVGNGPGQARKQPRTAAAMLAITSSRGPLLQRLRAPGYSAGTGPSVAAPAAGLKQVGAENAQRRYPALRPSVHVVALLRKN